MPALRLFGRKWLIASDDLVFPGLFEIAFRILWLSLIVVVYVKYYHFTWDCSRGGFYVRAYLLGMIAILSLIILVLVALVNQSARGAISDVHSRRYVPPILLTKLFLIIPETAINVFGTMWAFCKNVVVCPQEHFVKTVIETLVVFNWVLFGLAIFVVAIIYDPLGSKKYIDLQESPSTGESIKHRKSTSLWQRRFRWAFCWVKGLESKFNDLESKIQNEKANQKISAEDLELVTEEAVDRMNPSKNIIIFGIPENIDPIEGNLDKQKVNDVLNVITDVSLPINQPLSIYRTGKTPSDDVNKPRPVKKRSNKGENKTARHPHRVEYPIHKHEKYSELNTYLEDEKSACLFLTATWLQNHTAKSLFEVKDYSIYRSDRQTGGGGGTCAYLRNNIFEKYQVTQVDFPCGTIDSLFLCISNKEVKFHFLCMYRSDAANQMEIYVRSDEHGHEAFQQVAALLSSLFRSTDLVPTDILAGCVLLRVKQKRETREMRRIHLLSDDEPKYSTGESLAYSVSF
ncbi:hypothetical protein HHI36_007882 [Cryptolaemus montrouzieri]|uniref:Uncharacterized protein n=1 Tax=Cryptolaemus montrouzieri TaxID=559131 RepID=A0ABD2MQY9_9CUCU